MLDMTVDVLNAYVNGQLVVDDSSLDKMLISTAVIDSRVVQKDSLFIAFKGDSVDGHAYINAAAENGACIALVEDVIENAAIAQIKVSSCKKAMADLAIACRDKYQGKVIGITGSCGKTSTKEMLACILKLSASVSVTSGNQNNELGVPLTLFNIDKDSDYAVIEMGAAEKGDISYLMAMVKPDVVVVTNIRPAHIGRFGSEETIAETKSEIYRDLQLHTTAVINLDEKYSRQWIAEIEVLNKSQVLSFSMDHLQAELTITDLILSLGQSEFTLHYQLNDQSLNQKIRLNVAGEHNVANALAAASCALAVGISLADIAEGLANYHGVKSRMQLQNAVWGGLIIDDSYNANPASVAAAIDVLKHYPQNKILVLGDMAELGEDTQASHEYVGAFAKNSGINLLLTCGIDSQLAADAFGENAKHFTDRFELAAYLTHHVSADDVVLIKGSRSAAMEDIIKPLIKEVGK